MGRADQAEISIEVLDALEQEWDQMIWTRMLLNKSLVTRALLGLCYSRSFRKDFSGYDFTVSGMPYLRRVERLT